MYHFKKFNKKTNQVYYFSSSTRESVNIAIIGCGVVGLSFASALSTLPSFQSSAGQKVLLIDHGKLPKMSSFKLNQQTSIQEIIPNQRVYTLTPTTLDLFNKIGAFKYFESQRIVPFKKMQVWEQLGSSYLRFSPPHDKRSMGSTMENDHIVAGLYENLLSKPDNFKFALETKLEDITTHSNGVHLTLSNGEKYEADLVVGSDGRNSFVKKKLKIHDWGWNYNQLGIVCTLETVHPNNTAWQKFLIDGPIAILPLWSNYSSLVWTVTKEQHDLLMSVPDEEFIKRLNTAIQSESIHDFPSFGGDQFLEPPVIVKIKNKRLAFPLGLVQAQRYVHERVALIGDAAHGIHPMAGQGVNMGLVDVQILSKIINESIKYGKDISSESTLGEYEQKSKLANYAMATSIEFIKRMYEGNGLVQGTLRNLGVSLTNATPLKNVFAKGATGDLFLQFVQV